MTRLLFTLALALWSTAAWAHDARSAAVDVEVAGPVVTVHLAVTQAGLHAALEAAAGRALDTSDAGYPALVADHLRRTLRLSADGEPIPIGDVGLRLGAHQSDARFVADLPDGARALAVTVESFGGVAGHQTVVRVRQGEETTRAVLSDADGQTLAVALAGAAPVPEPVTASALTPLAVLEAAWPWWLGLVAALSLLATVRRFSPSALA